jgi:hypothetical protein
MLSRCGTFQELIGFSSGTDDSKRRPQRPSDADAATVDGNAPPAASSSSKAKPKARLTTIIHDRTTTADKSNTDPPLKKTNTGRKPMPIQTEDVFSAPVSAHGGESAIHCLRLMECNVAAAASGPRHFYHAGARHIVAI